MKKKSVVIIFLLFLFSCLFANSFKLFVYAEEGEDEEIQIDDQEVELDISNSDLVDNYIIISDTNVSLNGDSEEYLEDLLELGSDNSWSLLDSNGEEISCEEDACIIGTGMQMQVKSINNSEESTEEETKTYYIVVIGDITGDGLVEVNDIVKYKSQSFLNMINDESDTSELTNAYRKALQVISSSDSTNESSTQYTEVTVNSLVKHKIYKKPVSDIVRNISSNINLKSENVKIGDSDNYSFDLSEDDNTVISYKSKDEGVAVVSKSGVVTGRNKGETTIEVSSGTNTKSIPVQVVSAPKKVSFEDESVNLVIGDEYDSEVAILPNEVDNRDLTYTSSDESIATVSSSGKIKAIAEGNATITVASFNGKKSTCNVLVSKEITITMSTLTVSNTIGLIEHSSSVTTNDSVVDAKGIVGGSFDLNTDAKVSGTNTASILWSSSNNKVASVDSNGHVTLVGAGTAKILVTAGKSKISYTVEVYTASLGAESLSLNVGDNATVAVTFMTSKGKSVTASDSALTLSPASSNYYSVSVSSNKITFTGIASSNDNISVSVLVDKLSIGTVELDIDSSSQQGTLADYNGYVSFLPTQSSKTGYTWSESIILKSQDGSVAMVDTGRQVPKDNICEKVVYKGIKKASSADTPTLDYLIISHSHSDHTGCLSTLLDKVKDGTLIIKNIIVKNESLNKKIYNTVKAVSDSNKTNLITANSLANSSDSNVLYYQNSTTGDKIPYVVLGSSGLTTKIYLFNYTDVYEGNSSCNSSQYSTIKFRKYSKKKTKYMISGKCSGSTCYPVLKTSTATKITYTKDKDNKNYYYAMFDSKLRSICGANANSIAVLAAVSVGNNDVKYVYIPSDLENNGYPTQGSSFDGFNVTGNGSNYFYKYTSTSATNFKFTFSSGNLVVNSSKNIPISSEYNVAKQIKNNFDSSKIILYQASHHGYNVDPVSLNILNLNNNTTRVVVLNYNALQYPYNYTLRTNRAYDSLSKVVSNKHYYRIGYFYKNNSKGYLDFKIYNSGSIKVSHSSK